MCNDLCAHCAACAALGEHTLTAQRAHDLGHPERLPQTKCPICGKAFADGWGAHVQTHAGGRTLTPIHPYYGNDRHSHFD